MKNNINKLFLFCFILFVSLSLNAYNAQAKCATVNGVLETIEICDANGAGVVGANQARGGARTCADLGDTDPATSGNALWCKADCTIDTSHVGNVCSGGFGSPAKPDKVIKDIDNAVINATNWILGFMASLAVLALIFGGVKYLTSAGNEQQAEEGKKVIKFAIIGLVVAGIAYAIVNVIVATILV